MAPFARRTRFILGFGGLSVLLLSLLAVQAGEATPVVTGGDPENPTFYADVLPILQENCQACHQPEGLNMGGMVAPMSLVTYEEVRPWAPVIAEVIASGKMPPWSAADMHRGTFSRATTSSACWGARSIDSAVTCASASPL
jgi:mono/diheme cytochrome c family protein